VSITSPKEFALDATFDTLVGGSSGFQFETETPPDAPSGAVMNGPQQPAMTPTETVALAVKKANGFQDQASADGDADPKWNQSPKSDEWPGDYR
jgi:hypothetical protein